VLSGRCGDNRFAGELRLNDTPVLPGQMAELRPLIGYVPQDDVMHTSLSVRENIEFQAELRYHSSSAGRLTGRELEPSAACSSRARAEMDERIESVISGLGLSAVREREIRDGLSGGQRKRVSIGMEVVSKPRVLLLDEPSSGLDSSTAHRILEMVLRGSTAELCTTFATIHQPRWSTLSLFDMLVLLAPGGHLCFAGPVAAVKAYFSEVLHIEFPENENPADIILDACTFYSARKMAMEGLWKNPPQCLRAVLIPPPEAVQEEHRAAWLQEEFGKMLAALWTDFKAAHERVIAATVPPPGRKLAAAGVGTGEPALDLAPGERRPEALNVCDHRGASSSGLIIDTSVDRLTAEAREKLETIHWAPQVWLHVARALLLTNRSLGTVIMNLMLLMLPMFAMACSFPDLSVGHIFLPSQMLFLGLALAQSIAAQRLFGGEERSMGYREASVLSPSQALLSFIGKDLASLVEIALATLTFTLTFLPMVATYASYADLYAIGFACIYAVWGMSHIIAIVLPSHSAILVAVVMSFMSFVFAGLKPEASSLVQSGGGIGAVIMLASPVRWAVATWIYSQATGVGASFLEDSVKGPLNGLFNGRGFNLDYIVCRDSSMGTLERWKNNRGLACLGPQLFLLGFLFRFIAAMCLLILSSSRSSGGQLPLGLVSPTKSRFMHDCLLVFLIFLAVFNIRLLGETY